MFTLQLNKKSRKFKASEIRSDIHIIKIQRVVVQIIHQEPEDKKGICAKNLQLAIW